MKSVFITLLLAVTTGLVSAQTYTDSLAAFRKEYIKDLLAEKRLPLKPADVRYIHFYEADPAYRVWAEFMPSPGSKPFLIATHSGKQKPFKEYGTLTFTLHDTVHTLHLYQSVDMVNELAHKDELFLPFNDRTNYEFTFAGGRYIDLSVKDIVNGHLLLDFNKCYNPYCAYADGFSCPIPPDENILHTAIPAGEKLFTKNMGY